MRGLVSALCAVAVLRGGSGLADGGRGGAPDSAAAPRGDMVRAGSGSLRPRLLSPGTHAIRSFKLDQGAETPTSRTTQTVEVAELGGVDVYRIRTVHEAASDTTRTLTIVRRHDLALVRQEVRASRDSATVAVDDLHLTGWSVLPSRPVRELDVELLRPVLPLEGQMPWILGLLPLREGYVAAIEEFSPWEGETVWRRIEVLGSDRLRAGESEVDCWKLDAGPLGPPGYRATRWIDKRSRRVLQTVLRGEPGAPEYWSVTAPP